MLAGILREKGRESSLEGDTSQYVTLRSRLRTNFQRALQSHLMHNGHAPESMREDYLAWQLGL